MINSKGAYTFWNEGKDTSSIKSPTDGTFSTAMHYLKEWANADAKDKKEGQSIIFVNFSYTNTEYGLYCKRYPQIKLLENLKDLLESIYSGCQM